MIRQTVWPQYTNVTDKRYKRSPKNDVEHHSHKEVLWYENESSAKWRLQDKVWKVGNMAMKIMVLVVQSVAWAEAYLHTKWRLDPSNHVVTIHQRYRQTDR